MSAAEKLDLASAARRLAAAQVGIRERRRFRRMPMEVHGRMLDSLGREHDCRTADMSPGDVRIVAPILPPVGDRVVIYLEGFGRITGKVARKCGEGEVAVIFDFGAHKRDKLTDQLTIAVNKGLGIETEAPTIKEGANLARIEFEDGRAYEGEVLDFSLQGVTLRTAKPPPLIGQWVRVGGTYGRVARLIDGGFAVDFEPRLKPNPQG